MIGDADKKIRSGLINKVQAGKLKPQRAEAVAKRLGVGPIEGCRDPERFNPLQDSR